MFIKQISKSFEILRSDPVMSSDGGLKAVLGSNGAITVNGASIPLTCAYSPKDIRKDGYWTGYFDGYVGGMTKQIGTPTYNLACPFNVGFGDVGVKGDGTVYWKRSKGPTTGTNDLIVAIALTCVITGDSVYDIGTYDDGTTNGWLLYHSDNTIFFFLGANSTYKQITAVYPVATGKTIIIIVCVNRDENSTYGAYLFANGIVQSNANFYDVRTAPTTENPLQIFSSDGMKISTETIYGAAVWEAANIFSSGATGAIEMQTIASEITAKWSGLYPQKATTNYYLPTITRAGNRYFQNNNGFFLMENNTQLLENDGNNSYLSIYGERTNSCPYSSVIAGWVTGGAEPNRDVSSDSGIASCINNANWVRVVEGASTNWHGAYQVSFATPTQNQKLVAQVLLKYGDRRYLSLHVGCLTSGSTAGILVDMNDGSVTDTGTAGSGNLNDYGVITLDIANKIYLFWLCFSDGAATPGSAYPFLAMADSATFSHADYDVYTGDPGSYPLGMLFCGAQLVVGATCPGPMIETGTSAYTKKAEVVEYPVENIPTGDFTITGEFQLPNVSSPGEYPSILDISDEGLGYNRLSISIYPTSGNIYVYTLANTNASQKILTSLGNIWNGNWHTFIVAYKSGTTYFKVDNVDVFDNHGNTFGGGIGFTQFLIGSVYVAGYELNGKIRNVRVYNGYYQIIY